ncbi:MAG: DEAD/DEAH box helicase [Deltaproteobacteria bacterium]
MQHHPQEEKAQVPTFYGLGIAPGILDVLEKIKFKAPTPIQHKAIPLVLEGKDVLGIAQTGTGKTHAFAIPMVQRLARDERTMGLVLAPVRELALQIHEAFMPLAGAFRMNTACLIGGAPMEPQNEALAQNPRIVIATPGRLLDHMRQWHIVLNEVAVLVLDEADRMLDMGFAPQIEKILHHTRRERQTMLFSATMPKEIMAIANRHMKLPVSVEVAPSGTAAEKVTHELFIVKKEAKFPLLLKLLKKYRGPVLLFSRTKHNARKVARMLMDKRFPAAQIHSDRNLNQRRAALDGFKSGRYQILVATDVAARGIDVTGIELVINFDVPEDADTYVHRIGRTGRAGKKGHAISFATPDQKRDVQNIEKVIRFTLPVSIHPEVPAEEFSKAEHAPRSRRGGAPSGHGHRRSRGPHGSPRHRR